VVEHAQTDDFVPESDSFTYAVDEDGDLLWFVSPGVCYRRRKREAETAAGRVGLVIDPVDVDPFDLSSRPPPEWGWVPPLRLARDRSLPVGRSGRMPTI
jgi:hypothetical protein